MLSLPSFPRRFALAVTLAAVLASPLPGCATAEERAEKQAAEDAAAQLPVETMYSNAATALDGGNFVDAAQKFDDVDRQYPYSQWATRAQLMAGYAHYRALRYDEAVLALDRFIELHPGDDNVAYATYLRALCYYEQITDVRRDQRMTELALDNLQRVVERFPETKYARDAMLKIDLTQDHLAGKEMEIGRYYLVRKQYQAAINRFQHVVDDFQTTTHVPEALHRLTEAYLALGILPEAKKTAAILGYNYPESRWYKDTYKLMGGKLEEKPDASLYDKTIGRVLN